ncbi:MAG: alpha/beta hydrolase [Anaerolineae bacterium]|nr:alpha/beta hydrolase [Anaerolineae bacterium]
MKRIIRYKNGQTLAYAEYGDKNGYPILAQHGLIASISDYHLFDSLIKAGIRLICLARPGYGESSPYSMSQIAEWGEIVSTLANELNLSQFDLLGMSSGAPYSYAIGYQLPNKVRNIFIFSGIPALYDDKVQTVWPYPVNKDAGMAELEKLANDLFFANLSPEALLQNDIRDSMRNNCFGLALDFKLRCYNWGFLLSDVKEKVYMQHSRTDNQVPFAAAEITSKLLPNCRLEIRESGEHFSDEILDNFIKTTVLQYVGK